MILSVPALDQRRRPDLPAVSHDFALRGANFARIAPDFTRVYQWVVGGVSQMVAVKYHQQVDDRKRTAKMHR